MSPIRAYQGKQPRLAANAWIDPTALVIGDVEIGAGSSIWPMAVIRGDVHYIRIGAETNIQDGSVLHVSHDSRFLPGGAPSSFTTASPSAIRSCCTAARSMTAA